MIQPTVGFIAYGVHKDGLKDPMGAPFIDDALIAEAKDALRRPAFGSSNTMWSSPPSRKPLRLCTR